MYLCIRMTALASANMSRIRMSIIIGHRYCWGGSNTRMRGPIRSCIINPIIRMRGIVRIDAVRRVLSRGRIVGHRGIRPNAYTPHHGGCGSTHERYLSRRS